MSVEHFRDLENFRALQSPSITAQSTKRLMNSFKFGRWNEKPTDCGDPETEEDMHT